MVFKKNIAFILILKKDNNYFIFATYQRNGIPQFYTSIFNICPIQATNTFFLTDPWT